MPRILALYFPQYHADPINDELWGTNFTDWDSLRASPHFNREGYAIPRPTSELGYYDLSYAQPRQLQGQLAKQYGVDGFIYHHYWFYDINHPGPTLAKPLLEMLHDGQPDIPFFLNWCTVNWVNVWMGNAVNQTDNRNCISPRGKRVKCRCCSSSCGRGRKAGVSNANKERNCIALSMAITILSPCQLYTY
jgi:hypothetical protein